jgi:hypothetical protein
MSHAQLSLIEVLPPVSFGSDPVRGRRIALALTCDRHRAALQCLLQGPAPLDQVAPLAGAADTEKLALELRELGLDLDIPTVIVPGNGVVSCGAILRVGKKVLIDDQKFIECVRKQSQKAK